MKTFLLKAKHFLKRNIYPITVSFCTVLILGIVTVSAYNSIRETDSPIVNVETSKPIEDDVVVDTGTNSDEESEKKPESIKPTVSTEPIIFDLPFNNAVVTKIYADKSLLYDNTTKYWRTHQGLDFACLEGQEVVSVYEGIVKKIENSMMNGTTIYLKISDELTVVYKGLSSNILVKEGDKVGKGVILGSVTSFLSEKADGVHLHLELLKQGVLIDPTEYFSFNK
jgi:murein DD-endopeptidase MepM/ murein hydrolase activator NlpD